MKINPHQLNYRSFLLYFFLPLFYLSCNSGGETSNQGTATQIQGSSSDTVSILELKGNYHLLYCTSAEFEDLIKKLGPGGGPPGKGALVLKNFITPTGLTLHGWLYKQKNNKEFEDLPEIKFQIGRENPIKFSSGSYLGDFICSRKALEAISDGLKTPGKNYNFVILEPKEETLTGHIKYMVYLSEFEPKTIGALSMDPAGVDFNPIPPKGSNALEEP